MNHYDNKISFLFKHISLVYFLCFIGFLGSHVLKAFLDWFQPKFTIRGTVRNKDENEKLKLLEVELGRYFDRIEIVEADLNNPDSLDKAIEGCDYVVHTASPNPERNPEEYDQVSICL